MMGNLESTFPPGEGLMGGSSMKKLLCLFCILCLIVPVSAADLNVPAKSAVLMDVATGTVLYEKNAHEPLAPASVTKVMTMLLIMEAIDSGKIAWTDSVTASEAAAAKGGSQVYLKVGESMPLSDMVKSVVIASANDAAVALAIYCGGTVEGFAELMNDKAHRLGMNDTHFVNPNGLDAPGHYSTARDMAKLAAYAMENPIFAKNTLTQRTLWPYCEAEVTVDGSELSSVCFLLYLRPCASHSRGRTEAGSTPHSSCNVGKRRWPLLKSCGRCR